MWAKWTKQGHLALYNHIYLCTYLWMHLCERKESLNKKESPALILYI